MVEGRPSTPDVVDGLSAQVAVGEVFLPWIVYALPRMHSWASDVTFSAGAFTRLYATMLAVGSPLNLEMYFPLTLAVFVVLVVGVVVILRDRRSPVQSGALAALLAGLLCRPSSWRRSRCRRCVSTFSFSRAAHLPLSACFYVLLAAPRL